MNLILVAPLLVRLNPFSRERLEKIQTPWGAVEPSVDIFPVVYLLIMYGFIYIFPFGRDVVGQSWFDWCRSEDGPLEWLQFVFFLGAFMCSSIVVWKRRRLGLNLNWIIWILLALLCFFVAGEEISWGERVTGLGIDALREINKQGETNIHNLPFFHHILLDPSFELSCILFGWLGWRVWPHIDAFPAKRYSLYFLFVALFFFYFDISYSSTIRQIRNDQEIFEILMALGLFAHSWHHAFAPRQRSCKE